MNIFKLFISFIFTVATTYAHPISDWGPTGHRATGEIAQQYLKSCTKRKIEKLLQGESLAFVSTFADEIKSERKKYGKYYTWHFVNMPFEASYHTCKKNPKGDLITGINHCIKVLKDKKTSEEEKRFFLKMLVHFIGDMHQPMHVGLAEDWGGNKIQVQWHDKGSNLHRVWDEDLIEQWGMSYKELEENQRKLTKKEIKKIQEGTVIDWLHETHNITKKVYASAKKGDKLKYQYSYQWFPVVRTQLQKAGIRLAKLLNDIF